MAITEIPDGSQDAWRTLRALSGYRWVLAAIIAAVHFSGLGREFLGTTQPFIFQTTSVGYLLLTVAMSVLLAAQTPAASTQTYLQMSCDIPVILLLIYSSGGIGSGLGILLVTPIAAASFVVQRQVSILLAAVATIGVLALETYRQLDLVPSPPAFTQAGVLGAVLFITAVVGHALAARARESQKVAAKAELDLAGMARMNEAIIQKLHAGVLVIDQGGKISLSNSATHGLLPRITKSRDHSLLSIAPELAQRLESWKTGQPQDTALLTIAGKHSVLPYFSNISSSEGTNTLILLEDASRIAERAQQVRLAALGRLSASIAHEIRNPLGAISHAQQLLDESETLDDADRDLLAIIGRHTERINRIVVDVLGVSRKNEVNRQKIDLRETLQAFVEEFQTQTANRNISVKFDVQAGYETQFDTDHLRQIFFNMLENAQRHGELNSGSCRVFLSVTIEAANQPTLYLIDNGLGIPETRRQEIFEPFFTTAQKGSGLGLYICRELCEINQSELRIINPSEFSGRRPRWANGAAFRIRFSQIELNEMNSQVEPIGQAMEPTV